MKSKQQVIYYHDELTEDFSTAQIQARRIDASYSYEEDTRGKRLAHLLCYRVLARPIAWLYLKLAWHHRIVNGQVLSEIGRQGFFLYGNHTNAIADALIPSMVAYPKDTYVIVHPANVSMPVLGRVTPSLGALPLPDDIDATRHFVRAVRGRIKRRCCVMIYPEAHIWPYYTGIRPFPDTSFRYPVQCQSPVFCLTNTYQKRRWGRRPRIVTYVDGPFYADASGSAKEQKEELRAKVYAAMTERSRNNTVECIKYIKTGNTND